MMRSKIAGACLAAVTITACLGGVAKAGYVQTVLNDSPIAYWRLGEASGLTAANTATTGTTYAGTYLAFSAGDYGQTGALTGSGDFNTSVQFNGLESTAGFSNRVSIPQAVLQSLGTSSFSIEMWVNPSDLTFRGDPFWTNQNNASSMWVGNGVNPTTNTNTKLNWWCDNGVLTSTTQLTTGTWYQIVVTRDTATNFNRLYINGTLDVSGSYASATNYGTVTQAQIGAHTATTLTWNGRIDEVSIYNKALTASEVATHYTTAIVPEPRTFVLVCGGLIGVIRYARRKRKKTAL